MVGDNQEDEKYRVDIEYLEMIVQHLILNPMLQMSIERLWTKHKQLVYTYNRLDISMHTLPGGSLSYLTSNLFEGNQIPPIFFGKYKKLILKTKLGLYSFISVFFQSQKRVLGNYRLSTHHYEPPGGRRSNGELNLKMLNFKQDGNNFSRYTSTYQSSVADGGLMRYYRENFENLRCFGNQIPDYIYSTFKDWGFILGKILTLILIKC